MILKFKSRMRSSSLLRDHSGQALVEGALTFLLLFVFLFGIFEVGRFLQVQQALTDAAREGARRGIAPFTRTDTLATYADVQGVVSAYLAAASLDPNLATINVERGPLLGGTTEYTRVTVTYPYRIMTLQMFGFFTGNLPGNLTGRSLMRNETSP